MLVGCVKLFPGTQGQEAPGVYEQLYAGAICLRKEMDR
jgi:hypothetical protein